MLITLSGWPAVQNPPSTKVLLPFPTTLHWDLHHCTRACFSRHQGWGRTHGLKTGGLLPWFRPTLPLRTLKPAASALHTHVSGLSLSLSILFSCLFLSLCPFQLYFIPVNSPDDSLLSLSVLPFLILPWFIGLFKYVSLYKSLYWSFQVNISLYKSPSALI